MSPSRIVMICHENLGIFAKIIIYDSHSSTLDNFTIPRIWFESKGKWITIAIELPIFDSINRPKFILTSRIAYLNYRHCKEIYFNLSNCDDLPRKFRNICESNYLWLIRILPRSIISLFLEFDSKVRLRSNRLHPAR